MNNTDRRIKSLNSSSLKKGVELRKISKLGIVLICLMLDFGHKQLSVILE